MKEAGTEICMHMAHNTTILKHSPWAESIARVIPTAASVTGPEQREEGCYEEEHRNYVPEQDAIN